MLLNKSKRYLIQSTPPKNGVFIHHSSYSGLKHIVQGCLKESKPYKGVSLTTDPGRFLNPLGSIGASIFGSSVDGFVVFPAEELIKENMVIPCLYQSYDEDMIKEAEKRGFKIFTDETLPPEYKYILRYVVHNDMFIGENEWRFHGEFLNLKNYKIYVVNRYYKRLSKMLPKYLAPEIYRLSDYK